MKNVLVVDSNPKELITFQEWFKVIYNFDVAISSDGEKAIAILEKEDISVFCTGIDIPKFDGIELLSYMTRSHPETPCVVMSEHGVPWFREKPDRQDILYHIEKPVSPEALTTAIFVGLVLKEEGVSFKGISMRSFLPLVWKSGKTCCLQVESDAKEKGYINFDGGQIIGAGNGDLSGKKALANMAGWEGIKLQVEGLPAELPDNQDPIDIMEIFDISWIGERPQTTASASGYDRKPLEPNAIIDPRLPAGEEAPSRQDELEAVLKDAVNMLKKVKGYQAIGILNENGQVLAADSVDEFDLNPFKVAIKKMLSLSKASLGENDLGKCQGLTFHTENHTLILLSLRPVYHLIVVLKPNGNWYFAKCRVESGLLKDLENI